MTRLITALLLLLCCRDATAQYVNVLATKRVCGPLGCQVYDCKGSGVCIGKDDAGRYIVLTAGHCMSSGAQSYHVGQGQWIPATGVASSEAPEDIGILASSTEVKGCVPLADESPQPGSMVTVHSYLGGEGTKFHVTSSRVIRSDASSFTIEAVMQNGDSGGAVMQNGKLVGIVSSTQFNPLTQQRMSPSFITSAPAVQRYIRSKLGNVPRCGGPAPQPQQVQAPPPPDAPGVIEPRPDPISTPIVGPAGPQGPPGKDADVSAFVEQISRMQAEIAALKQKQPPVIPVELVNEDTGQSIGTREYVFDPATGKYKPIKLATKAKKVK